MESFVFRIVVPLMGTFFLCLAFYQKFITPNPDAAWHLGLGVLAGLIFYNHRG